MDEPTNHLDISTKEVLKEAIIAYEGTVIIVSHDREFLDGIGNKIYEFTEGNVKEYLGDINYFLGKKNLADMREIQTVGNANGQEPANPAQELTPKSNFLSHEDLKKAKRRIQYIERDIERLEDKIKVYEANTLNSDFYAQTDFANLTEQYNLDKRLINELMEEWEGLVEKVDN
jgi:ATP-binding cassette, subfamily F, member 3